MGDDLSDDLTPAERRDAIPHLLRINLKLRLSNPFTVATYPIWNRTWKLSCGDAAVDRGLWLRTMLTPKWSIDIWAFTDMSHIFNLIWFKAESGNYRIWVVDGYGPSITGFTNNSALFYFGSLPSAPSRLLLPGVKNGMTKSIYQLFRTSLPPECTLSRSADAGRASSAFTGATAVFPVTGYGK